MSTSHDLSTWHGDDDTFDDDEDQGRPRPTAIWIRSLYDLFFKKYSTLGPRSVLVRFGLQIGLYPKQSTGGSFQIDISSIFGRRLFQTVVFYFLTFERHSDVREHQNQTQLEKNTTGVLSWDCLA